MWWQGVKWECCVSQPFNKAVLCCLALCKENNNVLCLQMCHTGKGAEGIREKRKAKMGIEGTGRERVGRRRKTKEMEKGQTQMGRVTRAENATGCFVSCWWIKTDSFSLGGGVWWEDWGCYRSVRFGCPWHSIISSKEYLLPTLSSYLRHEVNWNPSSQEKEIRVDSNKSSKSNFCVFLSPVFFCLFLNDWLVDDFRNTDRHTSPLLHHPPAPTSTRPVTHRSRWRSSTRSTPPRAWQSTGSIRTSTGPTRATRASPSLRETARRGKCW